MRVRHDALLGFTDKLPFDHRRPPYGETGRPNARAKKPLVLAKRAVVVLSPPSLNCSQDSDDRVLLQGPRRVLKEIIRSR